MNAKYNKAAESSGKVQRALREKNYEEGDYLDDAAASAFEVQQMAEKRKMSVPQYLRGLLSDPAILSYKQNSRREKLEEWIVKHQQEVEVRNAQLAQSISSLATAAVIMNSGGGAAPAGTAAPVSSGVNTTTTTTTTRRSGSYTLLDAREQRSKTQSYGYMGKASGSCCGTCSYYVAATKECLQNKFRHPSGPNDYCGSYRS
jgi:hypothetical protein